MPKENWELKRLYASNEGVALNDPTVQRIECDYFTAIGEQRKMELEINEQVIKDNKSYVPLFSRTDEERHRLEQVLIFRPDATITPDEIPYIAHSKPRKDIVNEKVWEEYKTGNKKVYVTLGAVAAGLTVGAVITVYKWQRRKQN